MSRAYEAGKNLATIGGSAVGGLVPALAMDPLVENVSFIQENFWAYPTLMLVLGALLAWKGKTWMKPAGYGMLGAGAFALYRGYKAEAGNVYYDAGNLYGMPQREAAGLPAARHGGTWAYPYATTSVYNVEPS